MFDFKKISLNLVKLFDISTSEREKKESKKIKKAKGRHEGRENEKRYEKSRFAKNEFIPKTEAI